MPSIDEIIFSITSGLSILGSVALIIMFLWGTDKSGPFRKIFWMSVCDFGLAMKFWLPQLTQTHVSMDDHKGLCLFSAISGNFFGIATISWYFIIALCVHAIFKPRESRWRWILEREWVQHLYVWTLSLIGAFLPWWGNSYGELPDGLQCWIYRDDDLMKLTINAPIYVGLIFDFYLLGYVLFMSKTTVTLTARLKERMFAFVGVYIICWFWPGFNATWLFISPTTCPDALRYLEVGAVSGSGFCNFMVWITHPAYKNLVCDCFSEQSTATQTLMSTTEDEPSAAQTEFTMGNTNTKDSSANVDYLEGV